MARVLIVEDDGLLVASYERLLVGDGHDLQMAPTLHDAKLAIAWAILDMRPMPHVAIIDLQLGGDMGAGARLVNLLPICVQPIVVSGHDIAELRRRIESPRGPSGGLWIQKPPSARDWGMLRAMLKAAGAAE